MNLLRLLAPRLCAACGAATPTDPLCGGCRARLTWLAPLPVRAEGVPAWAPVAYSGPARDLVHALKFGGAWRAAETMAAQIAANAPAELLPRGPVPTNAPYRCKRWDTSEAGPALVPVPLHPRRWRKRGYDQASLLARALSERTRLPLNACLKRRGPARTQMGRTRDERLRSPPAIELSAPAPSEVILIDDVLTTGATITACAQALRNAGSRTVKAVAYARTPGR
jgi:ComF family protein